MNRSPSCCPKCPESFIARSGGAPCVDCRPVVTVVVNVPQEGFVRASAVSEGRVVVAGRTVARAEREAAVAEVFDVLADLRWRGWALGNVVDATRVSS